MKKILDKLEWAVSVICMALFVVIAGLIAVQVFTRYVLSNTLSWSEQAARGAFIWMIMLYSGVLVRKGGNLGFDIMTQRLPSKLKHLCSFLPKLLFCYFPYIGFIRAFSCAYRFGISAFRG